MVPILEVEKWLKEAFLTCNYTVRHFRCTTERLFALLPHWHNTHFWRFIPTRSKSPSELLARAGRGRKKNKAKLTRKNMNFWIIRQNWNTVRVCYRVAHWTVGISSIGLCPDLIQAIWRNYDVWKTEYNLHEYWKEKPITTWSSQCVYIINICPVPVHDYLRLMCHRTFNRVYTKDKLFLVTCPKKHGLVGREFFFYMDLMCVYITIMYMHMEIHVHVHIYVYIHAYV